MNKGKTIFVFSILVICFVVPLLAYAGSADNMLWGGYETGVQSTTGLGSTDPRETASSVVNIALGFLGTVFLLLIIYSIMGAGMSGTEEGADRAQKTIMAGVVGLMVVLMAYGLAQFIINRLYTATGAIG